MKNKCNHENAISMFYLVEGQAYSMGYHCNECGTVSHAASSFQDHLGFIYFNYESVGIDTNFKKK